MVTLKQTKKYYKNKKNIKRTILSKTGNNETIYGAQALNKQLPKQYRKNTIDYDIFSSTPKRDAVQTEKALDKKMGFNAFKTVPAQHEGTYRVKSNVDGEVYADYTKPDKPVPRKKIGKHYYRTRKDIKKSIKKTLKDPTAAYRHDKDRDALNRIKLWEQESKQKKKRTKIDNNQFRSLQKIIFGR